MRAGVQHSPSPSSRSSHGWRGIAGNSAWLLGEKALRWIFGLAVGIWTARYLGPADFGTLSATLAWVVLYGSAAGFGVEPIVVRELVSRPQEQPDLLATAFVLRIMGGFAAAALAVGTASLWAASDAQSGLVAIASLVTLLGAGETFDLWFQAEMRARTAALARTVAYLTACAARVALILNDASLAAFVWLAAAEAAATSLALGAVFLRFGHPKMGRFSRGIAREFLQESWPNIVANVATLAYLRLDRILLVAFSGERSAGVYSAAASLVEIWYAVPLALTNSATPLLTRLYREDRTRYLRELARLIRLQAWLGWALAGGLIAAAYSVVPLLFGPQYAGAAPVLTALALSLPFAFLGLAVVPWYLNERLTRVAMRRHLLGAALNIGLNLALIPRWGAVGAAVATAMAFAVASVFANAIDPRTRPVFRLQLRALLFQRPIPS